MKFESRPSLLTSATCTAPQVKKTTLTIGFGFCLTLTFAWPTAYSQQSPAPRLNTAMMVQEESLHPASTTAPATAQAPVLESPAVYCYTIRLLEIPADFAPGQTSPPKSSNTQAVALSSSTKTGPQVVTASYSGGASDSLRNLGVMNDDKIRELFSAGKIVLSPKLTVANGRAAGIFDGERKRFVTSCKIVNADDKSKRATIQPVHTTVPVGLQISLSAESLPDRAAQQVRLRYKHMKIERVEQHTIQTAVGPFTIDAPSIKSTGLETTINVPLGGTVAVVGGRTSKVVKKESNVPVLGKIPYVNRLFKNVSASVVDSTHVFLITCEPADANAPLTANVPDNN